MKEDEKHFKAIGEWTSREASTKKTWRSTFLLFMVVGLVKTEIDQI